MEEHDYCPQHKLIQQERTERYAEISKQFDECDQRFQALERRMGLLLDRATFWIFVGILVGVLGWLFLDHLFLREKISEIKVQYIQREEFVDWKEERERRLNEVKSNMELLINTKEDRHLGIHDNGKDSHR